MTVVLENKNDSKKRRYYPDQHEAYIKQGEACFYCNERTEYKYITVDHVLARMKGFTLYNNSVYSCRFCNITKGNLTIYQFRELLCHHFIFYSKQPMLLVYIEKARKCANAIRTCTKLLNDKTSILYTEKIKHRRRGKQKFYFADRADIFHPPRRTYITVPESTFLRKNYG